MSSLPMVRRTTSTISAWLWPTHEAALRALRDYRRKFAAVVGILQRCLAQIVHSAPPPGSPRCAVMVELSSGPAMWKIAKGSYARRA
jgi:hypothetical protein